MLPRRHGHGDDLEGKLSAVERFYAERARPARFQITPAAQPSALELALLARGYLRGAPTAVQTRELMMPTVSPAAVTGVEISGRPTTLWWEVWQAALGVAPARAAAVSDLFDRVLVPAGFVVAFLDDRPAAVALGVVDGGWLGIFNMATLPAQRRRGAGNAALAALADWGGTRAATTAYLQVDLDNQPARRLYRDAGFTDAYQYVYLSRAKR
ncbi:MAG: GNAT family N-acetyltransferase [Solirubrobacteraceae bacterium]